MPTKAEPNKNRPRINYRTLTARLADWLDARTEIKKLEKETDEWKKEFKGSVESFGVANENGSLFLDLPEPVGPIVALKNERRVSDRFNEEVAAEILRKKNLFVEPYVTLRPVIDSDAVRGAVFERLLTKSEADRIFTSNETFAFVAIDANGKAVVSW